MKKKTIKILKWTGLSLLGLWAVVLIVLQIVMNTSFLTRTVNELADQYVDGDIEFGRIEASMFRHFPYLTVDISDFSITYPHERFSRWDHRGIRARLREAGRGEEADTLASFRKFSVSVNYLALLTGKISIHHALAERPRIFAHNFGSDGANWDLFKFATSEDAQKDSTTSELPHITLGHIALTDGPAIVYTAPKDTIFATVGLKALHFDGKADIKDLSNHKIGLRIDSLFIAGRLPSDTLTLGIDHFIAKEHQGHIDIETSAMARVFMRALGGRVDIPIGMEGEILFPSRGEFGLRNFKADIATLDFTAEGDLRMTEDSTYVKASLSLNDCPIEKTIKIFGKNLLPPQYIPSTGGKLTVSALCDGYYYPSGQRLPPLKVTASLPKSSVKIDSLGIGGTLSARASADTDEKGRLNLALDELGIGSPVFDFSGSGNVQNALGSNPLVGLKLIADLSLDSLSRYLPEGMSASGYLSADLSGKIRPSQMNAYNFGKSSVRGVIKTSGLTFSDAKDSLFAHIDSSYIGVGKDGDASGLKAGIDSLYATIGSALRIRGKGLSISAQNTFKAADEDSVKEYNPIVGLLRAENLRIQGPDSLSVSIRNTENAFKMATQEEGRKSAPALTLGSRTANIFYRQGATRVRMSDAAISARARLQDDGRREKFRRLVDSLSIVYPGVPQDTLILFYTKARVKQWKDSLSTRPLDDIRVEVDEGLAKWLASWKFTGKVSIPKAFLSTPYFPLKNRLNEVEGGFDNDGVNLSGFKLRSGDSDLSAKGTLSGLKDILLGRGGSIALEMDVTSEGIDADQLLEAYLAGLSYAANDSLKVAALTASDEAEMVVASVPDTLTKTATALMLPSNLDLCITLTGNKVKYSDLQVTGFFSDIDIKNRCLQVTNTLATSNMGDINFEGFYSTPSKDRLMAGFDLSLNDITADKVIKLMPATDSIMPMLSAFKGMLDVEMAATTHLDSTMAPVGSTMNGVLRISGSDLEVKQEGAFRKLARTLMFKDKQVCRIQDMSVQGHIADNMLEIFPFLMKVDRYTLAMSGVQNFDQTFKYHVSVLKSPIPFRFGLNISGNFDDWKLRIGKAKYKNTNIPVFSAQLDTMQTKLRSSIHEIFVLGADKALKESAEEKEALQKQKATFGYVADEQTDSLELSQKAQLDSLQYSFDHPEDTLKVSDNAIVTDEVTLAPATRRERRAARKEERKAQRKEKAIKKDNEQ